MRRISAHTLDLRTLVLVLVLAAATSASASPWRSLISLPDDPTELRPLDRFVIGWQLHDREAVAESLEDPDWSVHLRQWGRARVALRRGDPGGAAQAYADARVSWPATREEPDLVQALFDRRRLELALDTDDASAARRIRREPLRTHDDAVWDALGAWLQWLEGDVEGAAEAFDRAWVRADDLERRQPVFLRRALVLLEAGRVDAAGSAWAASVDRIRRPERHRIALRLWDDTPELAGAIRRAEDRREVLRWLVRSFRRDDALELARLALEAEVESTERAWLYVFVAEQYYRLRRHDDLAVWLDGDRPRRLDDEQRAELDAYPLGVRRRSGHSVALAAAFDAVALRYPDTDRAVEALWEGAWMWELSGEFDTAIDRYEELYRRSPDGPYGSAAVLRSLWLRSQQDDDTAVGAVFARARRDLEDGLDAAAALRLAAAADPDRATALRTELEREHPFSPLWRDPGPARVVNGDLDPVDSARSLFEIQERAFERLIGHLGPSAGSARGLEVIERIAELGLMVEAETRLASWARERRGDTAAVAAAVRLAWRWGLPEVQGRYGWILERRLRDDGPELARAAIVAAMPTPYAVDVLRRAVDAGVDPALVWGLVRRESFYDADVVSIAGAHGLMQLIESTARETAEQIGLPAPGTEDLLTPSTNLRLGIAHLDDLLDRSGADRVRALAAYNAGDWNGRRWQERRAPGSDETLGILVISYSETRDYVYHVMRHWLRYGDLYAGVLGGTS